MKTCQKFLLTTRFHFSLLKYILHIPLLKIEIRATCSETLIKNLCICNTSIRAHLSLVNYFIGGHQDSHQDGIKP